MRTKADISRPFQIIGSRARTSSIVSDRQRGLLVSLASLTIASGSVAKFVRLCGAQSFGRYLIPAVSEHEPSRPDHPSRTLQPAKRVATARMIEPVIAGDEVSVKLGL